MSNNTIEILKKTKDVLKVRGRSTGKLVDRDGKCCLLGAVGLAAGVDIDVLREECYDEFDVGGLAEVACRELLPYLPEELGNEKFEDYNDVIEFNDGCGTYEPRTDKEVFDLLDRAIEGFESA